MTSGSKPSDTRGYVLDMLEQLGHLANSVGLARLAERIEAVVAEERAEQPPSCGSAPHKSPPPV